jgi:hypothetical protein
MSTSTYLVPLRSISRGLHIVAVAGVPALLFCVSVVLLESVRGLHFPCHGDTPSTMTLFLGRPDLVRRVILSVRAAIALGIAVAAATNACGCLSHRHPNRSLFGLISARPSLLDAEIVWIEPRQYSAVSNNLTITANCCNLIISEMSKHFKDGPLSAPRTPRELPTGCLSHEFGQGRSGSRQQFYRILAVDVPRIRVRYSKESDSGRSLCGKY